MVVEQSCSYYSRVLVPLYDTLGAEALVHIVNQGTLRLQQHPALITDNSPAGAVGGSVITFCIWEIAKIVQLTQCVLMSHYAVCVCVCVLSHAAETSVVLCHSSKLAILSEHAHQCPSLKTIITIGAGSPGGEEKEKVEKSGLKLYSMKEIEVCYVK